MIRLLAVEVRRALSRRLVRVLVVLAVLVSAATGILAYTTSDAEFDEAAARRSARIERTRIAAQCQDPQFSDIARGECERFVPSVDDLVRERDPRFRLVDVWDRSRQAGLLAAAIAALAFTAVVAGASFVGADWKHSTITTQLTWSPRRVRLLLVKAVAAGLVAFALAVVLQAVFVASFLPAVAWRGTTAGADEEWFRELALIVLRGAGLTGAAAVIGLAVANLGRTTAAALGIAFGYLLLVENLVRGLRPRWARWLVLENAGIVVTAVEQASVPGRTVLAAGALLAAYAAGLLLLAAVVFRRRDVT